MIYNLSLIAIFFIIVYLRENIGNILKYFKFYISLNQKIYIGILYIPFYGIIFFDFLNNTKETNLSIINFCITSLICILSIYSKYEYNFKNFDNTSGRESLLNYVEFILILLLISSN